MIVVYIYVYIYIYMKDVCVAKFHLVEMDSTVKQTLDNQEGC